MKVLHLIAPIVLLSTTAYCQQNASMKILQILPPSPKNTVVKTYLNLPTIKNNKSQRSMEYPTQIVRMIASVEGQQLSCDQVNQEIEQTLISHITKEQFTYSTLISCTYDPVSNFATAYEINSYFDPINDSAITYLNSYLAQYNGAELMGSKLNIESAKGLIIALNIAAGTRKHPDIPPFVEYRQDHNDFFFKSNYQMQSQLAADVTENFFSNDPDKIFPFLHRWIFPKAGIIYKNILRDANYVELRPARIFLMEKNGDIFVSKLKLYFAHDCSTHENHRCLKNV